MPAADALARVAVVGSSCAGKTTFARALGEALGAPHVELDALHWRESWAPAPTDEFRALVRDAVAEPAWIVDGNYSIVRDLVWPRATALVWLDYAFPLVFSRALWRTFRRIATQEELFAGNRETVWSLAEADGIPWWVIRTFRERRRTYPRLLADPRHAHLHVVRCRAPRDARRFLEACAG